MRFALVALLLLTNLVSAQPPKAKLNHLAIYVTDINASATFYQDIIGLETVPEPFHDGKHVWLSIAPGITLHIIEGAEARKTYYKNQHMCFSVSSVDIFADQLRKKNMVWEDRDGKKLAITTRVDGVKQLWLQDPDGYWVEINDAKE